ncbi:hypothetical protein EJB05_32935, partial [Eragrostis curvula]
EEGKIDLFTSSSGRRLAAAPLLSSSSWIHPLFKLVCPPCWPRRPRNLFLLRSSHPFLILVPAHQLPPHFLLTFAILGQCDATPSRVLWSVCCGGASDPRVTARKIYGDAKVQRSSRDLYLGVRHAYSTVFSICFQGVNVNSDVRD